MLTTLTSFKPSFMPLGAKLRDNSQKYCPRYMSKNFTPWMNQSLRIYFKIPSSWNKLEILVQSCTALQCMQFWSNEDNFRKTLKESCIRINYRYIFFSTTYLNIWCLWLVKRRKIYLRSTIFDGKLLQPISLSQRAVNWVTLEANGNEEDNTWSC